MADRAARPVGDGRARRLDSAAVAAATPRDRDRYLDLLRGLSILAVVVGHWLVADEVWTGSGLVTTSALGKAPGLWPLSWLLVTIPLFFFVAGVANRRSLRHATGRGEGYAAFVDRKVARVMAPTVVFLAVWVALSVLLDLSGGGGIGRSAAMLLQPLWFLGIYLPVVALTPLTSRWDEAWGWAAVATLVLAAVASDVARVGFGLGWVGNVNVIVVWSLVYLLGHRYDDGALTRRVAGWLAVGGFAATFVLTTWGPYPRRMVGVPGDALVNMHPPTLAVTGLAFAQVGVAVLLRDRVSPWLARPRVWTCVVWVNLSILTLYLWHETAMVVAARLLLPLGFPAPAPGTGAWWATRFLWLPVAGAVLALLVLVFGRFERVRPPPPAPPGRARAAAAVTAVVLLGLGLLALAGTRITELLTTVRLLGAFDVAPVTALLFVVAGLGLLRLGRRGAASSP